MHALFSFGGRVGRLPFALLMIVGWGLAFSAQLRLAVDMAIHTVDPTYPLEAIPLARDAPHLPGSVAAMILVLAAAFAIVLPLASLSLLARRFYDIAKSGWFVVPVIVLPVLVPNVFGTTYLPPMGLLVLITVMAVVPGTRGPNRFDATSVANSATLHALE